MTTPLACPHCKTPQPAQPPGVWHCGKCGQPFRVAGPDELAAQRSKKEKERQVLMLVGAVVFVVYVLPMLLGLAYVCFSIALTLFIMLGAGAAAMAG